jgi:cytochrome P450
MVRNALSFRRDMISAFIEGWREYGDLVRFELPGNRSIYLVAHPDAVNRVLVDNEANYYKNPETHRSFWHFLGGGLFTIDSGHHPQRREAATSSFRHERIARFGETMVLETAEAIERWRPWAERGEPFDIMVEVFRLSLLIVMQTLFSTDVREDVDALVPAVRTGNSYVNTRLRAAFRVSERPPLPVNRRFWSAREVMDTFVNHLILERRGEDRDDDLLSGLMKSGMTDGEVYDEIMTYLSLGYESTALCITWTLYLLSKNPPVERQLRAELESVLSGRHPSVDDISRLPYLRMVLQESLRLYPPIWAYYRYAANEDVVDGYTVPPGTQTFISPYVTHRHPGFWENPEGFDPTRFSKEQQPNHAYFPFSQGPRRCIGYNVTMTEAPIILAMVLQAYRVQLAPGHRVVPESNYQLVPKYGVRVRLESLP